MNLTKIKTLFYLYFVSFNQKMHISIKFPTLSPINFRSFLRSLKSFPNHTIFHLLTHFRSNLTILIAFLILDTNLFTINLLLLFFNYLQTNYASFLESDLKAFDSKNFKTASSFKILCA